MGITEHGAKFLIESFVSGADFRSTCTIGRQNLYSNSDDIDFFCRTYKASIVPGSGIMDADGFAEPFLGMLGAQKIDSIDASGYEGATVVHDMNAPLSADLEKRYTTVFEGGTIEHVYNLPQAMANIMQLVQVGGHLIFESPANNFCGHGFYQMSPEWFYRVLCSENGFVVERMILFEYVRRGRWFEVADPVAVGGRVEVHIPWHQTGLLVRARRESDQPILMRPPMQSDYNQAWQDHDRSAGSHHKSFAADSRTGFRKNVVRLAEQYVPGWIACWRRWKNQHSMKKFLPNLQSDRFKIVSK